MTDTMNIVLFEDSFCDALHPLGLFQPLHEISLGGMTLVQMLAHLATPTGFILRSHLQQDAFSGGNADFPRDRPTLLLNSSVVPNTAYLETIRRIAQSGTPMLATSGNRVAAAFLPDPAVLPPHLYPETIASALLELNLPLAEPLFTTVDWPHEVVKHHLDVFEANLQFIIEHGAFQQPKEGLFTGENVTICPSCIIDTSKGPIVLESGVQIGHFTFLQGPLYIGARSRVIDYSAIKECTAVASICKVGGEVEASLISKYSNKQHHGLLGHSFVGEWVNIGAGTSTSDLKNTYGMVRMNYRGRKVDTGMQFMGSILGDYVKSAVNTSLYTGKVVGVCSMLYGTVSCNVPSFTSHAKAFGQVVGIGVDQVIKTQNRMFSRRGVTQTMRDITLLHSIYDLTMPERVLGEDQINF